MRAEQGFNVLPLLALSLSFTAGIWLASFLIRPIAVWLVLAAAGCLLLVLVPALRWILGHFTRGMDRLRIQFPHRLRSGWRDRAAASQGENQLPNGVLAALCLVSIFLGAARYQATQPSFTVADLAWYNDSGAPAEIVGLVIEPPDMRDTHPQSKS